MKKQGSAYLHHESAVNHVTGRSVYVNDMPSGEGTLHGHVVYSKWAHARIRSCDLATARKSPGVVAVIAAQDIPGKNQMGPVVHDEPCLAGDIVEFYGQAMFLIAAVDEESARQAESLIHLEVEELQPTLDIYSAMEKNMLLSPERKIECGNTGEAFAAAAHIVEGTLQTGAQEHWYLETQSCLCVPGESHEMKVYSSTQHPSETQHIVAEVLGVPVNMVTVEMRRMGGAFGGKETQANHVAAWSALLANATGKPVKIHLFRDDDQIMTGKRHRFLSDYKAAFTGEGKIVALETTLNSDGGAATDLSNAIMERAMFHIDNAYFIPNLKVTGRVWKTNLPSNTAFRGFGGPQGMAVVETVIDRIARTLGKDAAEIRKINFYKKHEQNQTHYGQAVTNNPLEMMYDRLLKKAEYTSMRKAADLYNRENAVSRKGLALTPVKFGISFTTSFLNQAGALVHLYRDGTVQVNHGGTEMGQGLHTKILGIAARELGIDPSKIRITATDTSKVPNTSATAASSGSDLNGMAVKNAIDTLKQRLLPLASGLLTKNHPNKTKSENICIENGLVQDVLHPERRIAFEELINQAYLNQISLSATGFYRTPGIWFDKEKGRGEPFHYFAFGMAVSEILLDTLTGHHQILKTFIVHDVGSSLNPHIDLGQIEGGFVQGLGWCTTEDIKWNEKGFLLNHSPDTYKIPAVRDIPKVFETELLPKAPQHGTIHNSKAVGEPPLMLAFSVWLALKDAISAVGNHRFEPEFRLPATNEVILQSIEEIRMRMKQQTQAHSETTASE
ncbi:MAG: xanthine dehydrogenase molybdopterin binding subunit [Bacteroidales bacterium]